MDLCQLKISELEPQFQKLQKAGSYSEVTLSKMILVRMQCSLNKVYQHPKWQPPKSWTLYLGFQDVQDKHLMQYPLILGPKWKMHQLWRKNQSQNVPMLGYVYQNTEWPKSCMVQYGRPSCSSWAESVRSSFGRTIVGKAVWEHPIETWLGENSKLVICVCGWHKIGWKASKILIRVLSKEVDLGEPTSFLDHVYLGWTQRQCEISKSIVDNHRTMFESRISEGRTEKLPYSENFRVSSWSYDMEGHAKKCVERYCELANKTTQQLYRVSTPSIDDHHFKEEEMESVGELSSTCSQIVLKCLYLARIGRPDILWSVNKLARSITNWTKAWDKRLNRLISYIHHTCEYKQYCHVGNTVKQCRLGLFQDSDFAGDLEDSKSTSGGTLCVFGSHMFVPISWMCKKQTSVSHTSTEAEIVSLDAGLRMDGIPALFGV